MVKLVKHIKLTVRFLQKQDKEDLAVVSFFTILFLAAFRVLRDPIADTIAARASRTDSLPVWIDSLGGLLIFLALLGLCTVLKRKFPESAVVFYRTIGLQKKDIALLGLSMIFPQSLAESYFIVTFVSRFGITPRKLMLFPAVELAMLFGAFLFFRSKVTLKKLCTGNAGEKKNVCLLFFREKHLAFFYRGVLEARKTPDVWTGIILLAVSVWFLLRYKLSYYLGAYLITWLSMIGTPDCYRYDEENVLLFRVLRMSRKNFMYGKLFDLFSVSELVLLFYTIADLVSGVAAFPYATVYFLLISLYSFLVMWGANFICVRGYPDHHKSFAHMIVYSLLSMIPFATPVLAAFMIRKKSGYEFKQPL